MWTKCPKPQPDLPLSFSLNSTQAALTRASHSNRRLPVVVSLSEFPDGRSPGERKAGAGSTKCDRRSALSLKEIQESDNCSRLRMGCNILVIFIFAHFLVNYIHI